ncbi:DUF7507 domain-containing protein [Clostridium sp. B9]|uniref:DUF7507 domain-containing protein n=1 Tax=Clostridium sp. B9 TaxID=3423224 RepID=UPI003D2EBD6E
MPFQCNSIFYQFAGSPSTVYEINLITGAVTPVATLGVTLNGIGYNPIDNLIYGSASGGGIYTVDSDFSTTLLPTPTGLPPTTQFNSGTFDQNGYYYLLSSGGTTVYVIDYNPARATYGKLVNPTTGYTEQLGPTYGITITTPGGSALGVPDVTWDTSTNKLCGVLNTGQLRCIDVVNAIANDIPTTGAPAASYGAAGSFIDGEMYFPTNNTLQVIKITTDGVTATGEVFSTTTNTFSTNDGATCINASIEIDFGDAPDTNTSTQGPGNYRTLLASNGPRHGLINNLTLGFKVTSESDAYQNATATGDDLSQGIQDDAPTFPIPNMNTISTTYTLPITVVNDSGTTANLYAWVDFNKDGIFQTNESFSTTVPNNILEQVVNLTFTVPGTTTLTAGQTFIRTRITTDTLTNTGGATAEDTRSFGPAGDGEVEDYELTIEDTIITANKRVDKSFVDIDGIITYTVELTNIGTVAIDDVLFQDTIPTGTIYANNLTVNAPFTGTNPQTGLTITSIAGGQTVVISWQVQVNNAIPTPNPIENTGQVTIPTLPTFVTNTVQTQVNHVEMTPIKYVDLAYADIGDELIYTITFTNTGSTDADNVFVVDPIPNGTSYIGGSIVANVPITGDPTSQINLINPVAPGETIVISYRVSVDSIPLPNPIPNTAILNYEYTVDPTDPPIAITDIDSNTVFTQVNNATLNPVKFVNEDYEDVGATLTYTISFTNIGNVDAQNVVITDPIPNDTSYVIGSVNANVPFTGDPTTTINLINSVAPGESVILSFDVTIDTIPNPNPIPNTAAIDYDYEVDPANPLVQGSENTNTVFTQVNNALLNPLKNVDKDFADIGEEINYTITFTNTGNVDAQNVYIVDTVPNGTSYVPGSISSNVAFTGNPTSQIDLINPVAPGETVQVTFNVLIIGVPGENPIPNTATVNYEHVGDQTEPLVSESEDTNTVFTQVNFVDLNPSKTVNYDFAEVGDVLNYAIAFTNTGNVDAENVVITDIIPNDTTYVPLSVTANVAFTGNPTSQINLTNPIASGETIVINFDVTIDAIPNPNPIPNTATVDYEYTVNPAEPSRVGSENTNTVLTQVNIADLNPVKFVDKDFADVGDVITYTISFLNDGNVDAENVVITDIVPNDTTYVPNSINVNVPYTGNPPSQINLTNPVAPNETITISFSVTIDDIPNPNPIPNTATIDYEYIVDPTEQLRSASRDTNTVTTLVNSVLLNPLKSVDKGYADVGEEITYTLSFTNTGNADAENVVITDEIPNGTSYVAGSINLNVPFTGNPTTQISLTNSIAPGETVIVTFRVLVEEVPTPNPIPNTGNIAYEFILDPTEPSENRNINTNTVFTEVRSAELGPIVKSANKDFVQVGDEIEYTITFTNSGNVNAENVGISDVLPNGTSFVDGSLEVNVPYTGDLISGLSLTNPVEPGETIIIIYRLLVYEFPNPNPLRNTATVNYNYIVNPNKPPVGKESESNEVEVLVNPITISKTCTPNLVGIGDVITYNFLIDNTSNVEITNVIFFDDLPEGVEFIEGSFNGAIISSVTSADLESGVPIGIVSPREKRRISFDVRVTAVPCPLTFLNSARITFQGEFVQGTVMDIETTSNECEVEFRMIAFKQDYLSGTLEIPDEKPDIESLSDLDINIVFSGYEVFDSPVGVSNSKQSLSGKKMSVSGKVCLKIIYVANEEAQSVHSAHYEMPICSYIVLPELEDYDCSINLSYEIEDFYFKKISDRKFFYSITYIVESGL